MRRIAIVGGGQAGLPLALGLLDKGYEVTVVTNREPDDIRRGKVMSSQCMFDASLQIEREQSEQDDDVQIEHLNMMVPIDLLKPILNDLRTVGRVRKAPRPWLGLYTAEIDDQVVVVGVTPKAPAARAELKPGDLILAINGEQVDNCADFYRKLWALGPAGVTVPLTLYRGGDTFDVELVSSDRFKPLKKPRLH